MSGAGFEIRVEDAEVRAALGRLLELGQDLGPVMDEIGRTLVKNTQLRFEDQRGPDGSAWLPSLRARLQGGQTLKDTGRLVASITHVATGDRVEIGTNVLYAALHQFGGTIRAKQAPYLRFRLADGTPIAVKEVTIPARPFLGLGDDDREDILAIVAHQLREAAGA
ncbi:phage virion morphogenesis protein [Benzoatithermus flavus]|uniref:Phage virion morphogenesis protein n=1 Tax=Benzoatithermus flavus TaxID=3108223 RepID=A0ABU8XNU2_9PROT